MYTNYIVRQRRWNAAPMPDDIRTLLPLTEAAYHVLLALAEEETHGYAVLKAVEAQSGGAVRLSTGTLYGLLSRLLQEGLIEPSSRRDQTDERRRVYRLTTRGRVVVRAECERLESAAAAGRAKPLWHA